MSVRVVPLADRPELVPVVAGWIFAEWGHLWPGTTPEAVRADITAYCRPDALPLVLVACEDGGGACVGTASLRAHSDGFPPALTPWLVRVYVPPEARGRGVGAGLVRAAEETARALGAPRLYLCTPDRQAFYARLGWSADGRATYHDQAVTVMSRRLA
ncbi:MAG TPA: GNAT family N-acetyltransferase [Longimicrobiaceae bacterium]